MWVATVVALAAFIGAAAGTAGGFAIAVRLYLPKLRAAMAPSPTNPDDRPAWAPAPVEERHPDSVIIGGAQFSRMRRSRSTGPEKPY